MLKTAIVSGLAYFAAADAKFTCSFDAVASFRSADVAASYDPALMDGFWYEQAHNDPAQIGARCQTVNATYDASTKTLDTDFFVRYGLGIVPFAIKEHYVPDDTYPKAVYRKSVTAPFNIPGGHLVGLPTTVVYAKLSADKSQYEHVVLFSCYLAGAIEELVLISRTKTIAKEDYTAMIDSIKSSGLPFDESKLQPADHSQKYCGEGAASQELTIV